MDKIFNTDKRIRLGILGLGRGGVFVKAANALNIDVVAGCDLNADLREKFRTSCPDAMITDDDNEFFNFKDMDAVLIATYFTSHAEHTIRALEKGLHVMCEVTSFFTPAEGVRVVEAVEKSGKVYNLLENYPFTKENMFLKKLWDEGLFGEFQYGEFEYLHDCRTLCYCYNAAGSPPVEPGYQAHSWRAHLDFHYYATHSLGPLMKITGLRPEKITALPEKVALPGFLPGSGMAKPCPSLIQMSNGGLMRNLTGATTGNYHMGKRIWGTRASAESLEGDLKIRIGATGSGTPLQITPEWPELGEYADAHGHGGGDFWELYYFAREILFGTPAPWDIYHAADVTLSGIMAVRSHENGGQVMEIPDFRDKSVRDKYRNDNFRMTLPFEPDKIFPDGHDKAETSKFNQLMRDLLKNATNLRCAIDGAKLYSSLTNDQDRLEVAKLLNLAISELPETGKYFAEAEKLAGLYPDSPAAYALHGAMSLIADDLTENIETELKSSLAKTLEK